MRRLVLSACALLALAACSPKVAEGGKAPAAAPGPAAKPTPTEAPAGLYTIDPSHTSLTFRVNHLGLSHYTARFTGVKAELQLDPADPSKASLKAVIDPRTLETDYPSKDLDFDAELYGPKWLDAAGFPQITFTSTRIEMTGANTAKVTGDLSLHGVTRPVTLETTFNGGYAPNGMDPMGSRIGFSARGGLKRSEFGVAYGVPPKGSNMGVSDEVEIIIETEFTRPADAPAAPAAPK
jgi:polyisoprenoid-binding protein YceI